MISLVLGLCSCLLGCIAMYAYLPLWLPIFTVDAAVMELVKRSMPFVFAAVVGWVNCCCVRTA